MVPSEWQLTNNGFVVDTASRAVVKGRPRPVSRASTASIHSIPQHSLDQSGFADASDMYNPNSWLHNEAHRDMSGTPQMSPEDILLQAASHMQAPGQEFSMDASMGAPMQQHPMQYQQRHPMARHPLPVEQFSPNTSFAGDTQMFDQEATNDGEALMSQLGPTKPQGRSSANNELEMRQLFRANQSRSLQDVAKELHGDERGPNSERTRQVFAMLWINTVCSKGKGSVPRGRVYANYASRCATERITVLNPASFGKLVRVLFPGLKTRRLGVRGESKYHYVNFTLVDDEVDLRAPSVQPTPVLPEPPKLSQEVNTAPSRPSGNPVPAPQPAPQPVAEVKTAPSGNNGNSSYSIYHHPHLHRIETVLPTSTKTILDLSFPSKDDEARYRAQAIDTTEGVALPAIEPYLPEGTDPDAAKSLSALYRSHCTSLLECIRYCREKTFFHLYTSFLGTLTMPVQKLLGNPALAPWIERCDFILYQLMMSILSGLTLQVVPKPVMDTMKNITEKLVPHIRESFQGQPPHVIRAKETPAVLFTGLLDRALRVNLTAHAAANMLANPANRDQMYMDWISIVRLRRVAESVPTRGMDDLVSLLIEEMRNLINPTTVPWELECVTIYSEIAGRSNRPLNGEDDGNTSEINVLDRWVEFLRELPAKFPYASHAELVWAVERVGTAVMRDLTLSQGKSFGSWWVTKVWLDEMVWFMTMQGGFMKMQNSQMTVTPASTQLQTSTQESKATTSSRNDDLNLSNLPDGQAGRAPFPPVSQNQNTSGMSGGDSHDDSGIGIRTPEDDFPMEKFGFTEGQDQGVMTDTEL